MTYCLGIAVAQGVLMMADTRTNAGVDNIAQYRKLRLLDAGEGRVLAIASAGNLSTTQMVHALLEEGLPADPGRDPGQWLDEASSSTLPGRRLADCDTLFRAVELIGDAVRLATDAISARLQGKGIDATTSLLVAGHYPGSPPQLYLIYPEGNAILCDPDSPFLQIGELKYGKPILDRMLTYATPFDEAVKTALLSFDATMRSNLSVGMPIDLIALYADPGQAMVTHRFSPDDAYFEGLSNHWAQCLIAARDGIADPPFLGLRPAS